MVDGARTDSEIKRLASAAGLAPNGLEILVHGGYVQKKPMASPVPLRAGPKPEVEVRNFAQASNVAHNADTFKALYEYLVGQTKELLGLRGFGMQLRIEQAGTMDGLQAMIGPLSEAIAKKHGLKVATNFKAESERLIRLALAERVN